MEADFTRYQAKGKQSKELKTRQPRTAPTSASSNTPASQCPTTQRSSCQTSTRPTPPVDGLKEWWIARATSLPESSLNGWVLACMLDEYTNETLIARACEKPTFAERVSTAGLHEAFNSEGGPRKRCKLLAQAGSEKSALMEEGAQRSMIAAIAASLSAYSSGIKCWAAFCDAMNWKVHFPATEDSVVQYASIFNSPETFEQYKKHLRWAHRCLRLPTTWDADTVKQVQRGLAKVRFKPKIKIALIGKHVKAMVNLAVKDQDYEVATLMAVSRAFMLRVPSEGIPMTWKGENSSVDLTQDSVTLSLAKRKNSRTATTMTRKCCCLTTGRELCAVHWLTDLRSRTVSSDRIFHFSPSYFNKRVKEYAMVLGLEGAARASAHGFRRGMAQDIVDAGGEPSHPTEGWWMVFLGLCAILAG